MRRAHALLLLLAVLIAFALWWLLGGGGGDARGLPEEPAAAGAAETAAGSAVPEAGAAQAAAELSRTEAPALAADPAAAEGRMLTVRVILGDIGSPAAGAEVLLVIPGTTRALSNSEQLLFRDANLDQQLDGWGKVYRCDANGLTKVPVFETGWFAVGARMNDLWGRSIVKSAEVDGLKELVIALQPAIHVRVLVMDEARQPVAGAPVAYRPVNKEGQGNDSENAVTGADGIAALRHLQEEYERNKDWAFQHLVALEIAFEPTVQVAFDPLNPPTDPILLTMPATGSVEVEVSTLDGKPAEGLQVALQKKMSDADRKRFIAGQGMEIQNWLGLQRRPVASGLARFERVGLGLTLEFGTDFERAGVMESGFGPGPQRPGETVRFVLRQTASAPVITGRLVTSEGQPVSGFDFMPEIYVPGVHHPVARQRMTTDAEGRFRFPLELDPADTRPKILMASQEMPGLVLLLIADFPAPLTAGVNDLGDLTMGGPLLVSGVVLSPDGEPVPTAYGSVEPGTFRLSGTEGSQPYDDISWKPDSDGRFEIRGNLPPGNYQMRAAVSSQPDWRLAPQPFSRGASGLELRLQRPPGVRGRVLADAGVSVDDLSIGLMHEGGGTGTSPQADDGTFTLLIENPGTYDLEIRAFWSGHLLFAQRGLSLAKGGSMDVGDIDLRGLPRTRIVVLDPDGQPVPRAGILIQDGTSKVSRFSSPMDMPITLLHTREQRTVLLEAAGFARQEVALNGSEQTVRLMPGISISLTLEGLPPAPEGWDWRINLTQRGDGQVPDSHVRQSIASGSNQINLGLPVAGTWKATLDLAMTNRGGQIPRAFGDADQMIEVRPGPAHQEFSLVVNGEAVALGISKR